MDSSRINFGAISFTIFAGFKMSSYSTDVGIWKKRNGARTVWFSPVGW